MRVLWALSRLIGAPVLRKPGAVVLTLVLAAVFGYFGAQPRSEWFTAFVEGLNPPDPPACEDLPTTMIEGDGAFTWPDPLDPNGVVRIVVTVPGACIDTLSSPCVEATRIDLTGDDNTEVDKVRKCVKERIREARAARLTAAGFDARPGETVTVTTADPTDWGGLSTSRVALYFSMVFACTGMVVAALPAMKLSGTLEAILATGVRRRDLTLSLLFVTTAAGLLTVLPTLLGSGVAVAAGVAQSSPFDVHLLLLPLAVLLLAATSIASIANAAGATDANVRIAVPMLGLPLLAGISRALDAAGWPVGAFVPIGGLISLFFESEPLRLGPTVAAVLGAVAVIAACTHYVTRQYATGMAVDPESGGSLRRHAAGDYRAEAILLGIAALPAMLFLLSALSPDGAWGFAAVQIGAFALPALMMPVVLGLPVQRALGLYLPPPRVWVLIPGLVAASATVADLALILLPPTLFLSPAELEAFASVALPFWVLTLCAGIPEELLFRGAVQGLLLRGSKPAVAIVVQAVLFALVHGSAVKLAPVFVIGLLFGWIAWRCRSVLPGMVAHMLHNAWAVTRSPAADETAGWVSLGALGIAGAASVWLLGRAGGEERGA